MHHSCEHCTARYEIPDDKVQGRFLKVRCKRCEKAMHVVGIEGAQRARPPDLDPIEDGSAPVWWCDILGRARGPHTAEEVLALIAMGDVHARTRLWREGMTGWERIGESSRLHCRSP